MSNVGFTRIRRRTFAGVVGSSVVILVAACTRRSRYLSESAIPNKKPLSHEILKPWQRNVLYWITETMIPTAEGWPTVDELHIVEHIEEKLSHSPKTDQDDFAALLALVEYGAPFLGGGLSTFSGMRPQVREEYLGGWESSTLQLKRTGFAALKYMVMMHYYDNPRSWSTVGYPGPPQLEKS